jgi:hypothetical protein
MVVPCLPFRLACSVELLLMEILPEE